jgi:hypothetical protein
VGRTFVAAGSVDGTAEVVHDQLGAAVSQQKGMLLAEAATSPGDDRNFVVETEICHGRRT